MKVAINTCYGGFHLSDKAYERLIELGIPLYEEYENSVTYHEKAIFRSSNSVIGNYWDTWTSSREYRTDPLLIQVIEELGDQANTPVSKLKVVEIPDGIDWMIDEYDGIEQIEERHRSWS